MEGDHESDILRTQPNKDHNVSEVLSQETAIESAANDVLSEISLDSTVCSSEKTETHECVEIVENTPALSRAQTIIRSFSMLQRQASRFVLNVKLHIKFLVHLIPVFDRQLLVRIPLFAAFVSLAEVLWFIPADAQEL